MTHAYGALSGRRGGAVAAAHADGELPVGVSSSVSGSRPGPWRGVVLGGRGRGLRERPRPPPAACRGRAGPVVEPVEPARSRDARRAARRRARLLLVGSAASFGLMAVLARASRAGAGGFTRRSAYGHPLRHRCGGLARWRSGSSPASTAPQPPALWMPRRLRWPAWWSSTSLALQRIPAGEAGSLYNLFPVTGDRDVVLRVRRAADHRTSWLGLARRAPSGGARPRRRRAPVVLRRRRGRAPAGAAVFAATSGHVIRAMRGTDNARDHLLLLLPGGPAGGAALRARPLAGRAAPWAVALVWRSPPSPPRC